MREVQVCELSASMHELDDGFVGGLYSTVVGGRVMSGGWWVDFLTSMLKDLTRSLVAFLGTGKIHISWSLNVIFVHHCNNSMGLEPFWLTVPFVQLMSKLRNMRVLPSFM